MEGAEITKNSMLIYILVDPLEPYTQQTATIRVTNMHPTRFTIIHTTNIGK